MNNMKFFGFVILGIVLFGCGEKSELVYEPPVFNDTLYLEAHILNDTFVMEYVAGCYIYKNYLILFTEIEDYQFYVFDKNSGLYLTRFGSVGRGPGEIIMIGTVYLNQKTGDFLAVHLSHKKAVLYNVDSVLFSNHAFYKDISFENLPFNMNAIFWTDTSYYTHGSNSQQPEYRLAKWSKAGELLDIYSEYLEDIKPPFSPTLFGSYSLKCFSPDGTLFVEALEFGDIMDIFDLKDSIRHRVTKRFHQPEIIIDGNMTTTPDNAVRGFMDITSTNKRIYGIYQGDRHYYWSKNIGVFDWDGNPLRLYHTDYDLTRLCIDEQTNRIYAVTKNKDGETILVYFILPADA